MDRSQALARILLCAARIIAGRASAMLNEAIRAEELAKRSRQLAQEAYNDAVIELHDAERSAGVVISCGCAK